MKKIDLNNIDSSLTDEEMEHAGLYLPKRFKKLLRFKAVQNDRSLSEQIFQMLKESVQKDNNST